MSNNAAAESTSVAAPENSSNTKKKKDKLDYYFDSYSHYGIHEEMIKDTVRTNTYRNAIVCNPHLFKGKTVLDIGCGTGILCLFAASAGAKKVIGIECAHIADQAKIIVKDNGFAEVIEIVKGKVEEVELSVGKVDIIISEWMGYFLLYESMLDTVLFARDKWLKPDGILMPDRGVLYIAGLEDADYKQQKVHFWENVYNYNMSCVKQQVIDEPLVDVVDANKVCTICAAVLDVNLYKVKKEDLDFKSSVELHVKRNDGCHALVAWFEVEFSKCHRPTGFSTGPHYQHTHWKQTVFYLPKDVLVSKDTKMQVAIGVERNYGENRRQLNISLEVNYPPAKVKENSHQKHSYVMR